MEGRGWDGTEEVGGRMEEVEGRGVGDRMEEVEVYGEGGRKKGWRG